MTRLLSGSSAADDVADGLAQLPDLELRRLANACYDECVQQRISAQKTADKLQESEVSLLEAQRALHEARVQTQALCEAHDSEKTRIQHEYEEKLAFIIEQLQVWLPTHLRVFGRRSRLVERVQATQVLADSACLVELVVLTKLLTFRRRNKPTIKLRRKALRPESVPTSLLLRPCTRRCRVDKPWIQANRPVAASWRARPLA